MEGSSSNATLNTWKTRYPDYTISGISTCNDIPGTWAMAYSGNQNDIQQVSAGIYCWCRMMLPVRSAWVYNHEFDSGSDCGLQCAEYCNSYARTNAIFRTPLFGSAGN